MESLHATDVIPQKSHKRNRTVMDIRLHFNGKHQLYGLKTERFVLAGLAVVYRRSLSKATTDLE